jgi:hypothetical protein
MASSGDVVESLWSAAAEGGSAWRDRVRALPLDARRRLLTFAESTPSADADGSRRLYEVTAAVAPDFDPMDVDDSQRMRRLLESGGGFTPDLELLMKRAAEGAADPEVALSARLVCGQWCVVRDRLDEAERWYRTVLVETRGSGSKVEGIVTVNFARLCMGARRDVEALVLARRAAALLELRGEVYGATFALIVLAHVLAAIEDWERLEALLEEIEQAVPAIPEARRASIEFSMATCLADLCVARGRTEQALVVASRAETLAGAIATAMWTARSGPLMRIPALVKAGRVGEAASEADAALAQGPTDDEQGLRLLSMRVEIAAGRGERTLDRLASTWIELLEGDAGSAFGPGRRLDSAQRVADALRRADAAPTVARRAYDVAAAAALERLAQLDRFARDFLDIATPGADDRATLDDFRARTTARRADLLVAVARLLEAEARAGRRPLAVLSPDGGLVCTCAWCGSVRTSAGRWMPMPELLPLLPATGPVGVTHGICDACLPTLAAQLQGVRDHAGRRPPV